MVQFYSQAVLEDIKAVNTRITALFNRANGDVALIIPVASFQFDKKLMQEHFNEKYMESDQYPNATFAGTISGFDWSRSDEQPVVARGKLTIHGVTQEVTVPGTLALTNGLVVMKAAFTVKLEDYRIKRPQLLWQNIAEQVEVTLDLRLKPQP
jgi:polyisoprenoid-binding protein YceI